MTQQLINIGLNANDGTGDSLRTAFGKINQNFSSLFTTALSSGPQGGVQYRATVNLVDLAYNGTQYIALATPNRILVSTDAVSWSTITSPSTKTARAVTTVGTSFVIVGDTGLVMTSPDGSTWTTVSSGTSVSLSGIAYDTTNTVLVAVGNNGTTMRSTDSGATWTTVASIVTDNLNAVTWAATLDLFVAVGDTGTILVSADGTSWSQSVSGTTANLNAVSSQLNDVVVVGDTGTVITSPNTAVWSVQTSTTTSNLTDITVATLGTTVTAIAVGDTGTVITSAYDTTFSFNAWNATSYPSTTTADLATVDLLNGQVFAGGYAGTLINIVGSVWTDSGIALGIEGNSGFTFDPASHVLSLNADIIPQTTNTWSLGSDTNRYDTAYFNTTGVTIGNVALTETSPNTLSLIDQSGNLANLEADTGTFGNIITDNLSANLANIALANIANLETADANIGNLTVANLTLTTLTLTDLDIPGNITANNANFTGDVTANAFIGDGSQLTNLTIKASGPVSSVQFADVNLDLSSSANLIFDATTNTLSTTNITAGNIAAATVTAANVVSSYLHGDGSNITGLPVNSIVAGTDISVSNVGGIWTITSLASSGGGGGGGAVTTNPSHGPINSVQYAGPSGTFDSSSALQFDPSINELSLTGNVTAFNFNGNVQGGNGDFALLTAAEVIAVTLNGDLHGNVFGGNVNAGTGTFSGNVTAGNIVTGNLSFNTQTSNAANIGNIHIARSNIHEFGAGNDDFVIDTVRANLVIQGANVATLDVDAPFVLIRGGNVAGNAQGGNVTVESGSGGSAGKAGTLTLKGGQGGFGNDGGNIDILGGNGGFGGDGGSINIIAGVTDADTATLNGANLYLQAGNSINEDAGTLVIQGGNAQGTNLYGGNVTITAGTGSQADGHVYIANIQWPNDLGLNNQVLTTDGNGVAYWETVNAGGPGTITVSNIVHGFSNVEINTHSGPVTVGIGGTANVATFTSSGLETLSVKTNHIILGNSSFTASDTWWVDAQTSTAAPSQVLFEMPASGQNSVDFKVIAYDVPASNKQSSMITTVTYGTSTNYSVYATTMINTMIASYTVDQSGGKIRLLASPSVNYLVRYTVIITKY